MKVVGLMSGTSMDGMDAALLEVEGESVDGLGWELLAFRTRPYRAVERKALADAIERGTPESLCRLHADLGGAAARAVGELLEEAGVPPEAVAAVGSHGHTVWHDPPGEEGRRGSTLQLGDPATLAEATGIPVVSDFRARDVAAGGHGAPLVPFADRLLFSRPDRTRALQNLGGMGNVTWLPPIGSEEPTLAFDTGPGVALLDAAAGMATAGEEVFDRDGRLAARGMVDPELLEDLMAHPFLHRAPPRSTGREAFGPELVRELAGDLPRGRPEAWCDLLATLTAFTARSVGDAYRRWIRPRDVDEVVLTGGGARNPALREALTRVLAPLPVRTGARALGMDPDAREAAAFAVLAWAHLRGIPGNVPGVTGASGPRVLGSRTPGREGARGR